MQLTRCCFVFLVQGSLYLVSGLRGAARRGGGLEDWGRAREAPEPGNFLLPPQHPRHGGDAWRLGGEGGSEDRGCTEGVNRGGERVLGWPTHQRLVAGCATSTRVKATSGSPRVTRPFPRAPGCAEGEWAVRCGAGDLPGQGAWAFSDLGDPEGPRLGSPARGACPGMGRPPRPSLPPSLPRPPSPPVVFLSSPGCAQLEPHRTWAGGSRPGRSRLLSGASGTRSPCARSRLPGGQRRRGIPPQPPAWGFTPLGNLHPNPVVEKPRPTSGSDPFLKTIIIPFAACS